MKTMFECFKQCLGLGKNLRTEFGIVDPLLQKLLLDPWQRPRLLSLKIVLQVDFIKRYVGTIIRCLVVTFWCWFTKVCWIKIWSWGWGICWSSFRQRMTGWWLWWSAPPFSLLLSPILSPSPFDRCWSFTSGWISGRWHFRLNGRNQRDQVVWWDVLDEVVQLFCAFKSGRLFLKKGWLVNYFCVKFKKNSFVWESAVDLALTCSDTMY